MAQLNLTALEYDSGSAISANQTENLNEILIMARNAQKNWREQNVAERIERVAALRPVIKDYSDKIVRAVGKSGKPELEILSTEIGIALQIINYYCPIAEEMLIQKIPKNGINKLIFAGKQAEIIYDPYGVFGMIPSWNQAFQFVFGDAVPALLAGNTVITKPSEFTDPETISLMREIIRAAGLKDQFYVIEGGKTVGEFLTDNCDGIHFTGSTKVGLEIKEKCQSREKQLGREVKFIGEMGGFDTMIVFPDAKMIRAVNAAVWGRFSNSGQNCNAIKLLCYIGHESEARAFGYRIADEAKKLRPGKDYGPVIHREAYQKIKEQLEKMILNGAECLSRGNPLAEVEKNEAGRHFPPTVVFWNDEKAYNCQECEETFGPILQIVPVVSEEKAVELVNENPYGLSASVWTNDDARTERLKKRLDVGNVIIRDVLANYGFIPLPFAGRRLSGVELRHGWQGLLIYARPKSIFEAPKRAPKKEQYWFPYGRSEKIFKFLVKNVL